MDMYEQSYQSDQNHPYPGKRSAGMETASLVLGVLAILSCTCLYVSIPCGALAIIFASLSRGGMMSYTSRAQLGMIFGILALVLTITIYTLTFLLMLHQYGSIEGILKAYSDLQGMDYNELMQELMPK